MLIRDRLARDGNFLFRWRSYVPLVLLPLILFALPEAERISAQIGHEAEHIVFYLAMLVSFAGLAIRWLTVAFVPPGTSGRNTLSQRADQLNTTGMYSILRNPLYLGNFIAMLGVLICIKVWWVIAIFALCYWLYIERVIAVEEAYLEQKFGDAYRAWTARVPAFIPRFANWAAAERRILAAVSPAPGIQWIAGRWRKLLCSRTDHGRFRPASSRSWNGWWKIVHGRSSGPQRWCSSCCCGSSRRRRGS